MAHITARRVLAILSLCALGLGPCTGPRPTPTPEAQPIIVARPSASPTPTVAVTTSATLTPTVTEIPKEAATVTATVSLAANTPESPSKFTPDKADGLILQTAEMPGYRLASTIDYSPTGTQALKEWFGSPQSAQPFIDTGLVHIAMSSYVNDSPCTKVKVCWATSSAMIFSGTTGASQAPSLLLNFEKGQVKDLKQLTLDQLGALTVTVPAAPNFNLVGTTGTSGIGQYAQTTISFYASYNNAVLILQAGGAPGAIALPDPFPLWQIMYGRAIGVP